MIKVVSFMYASTPTRMHGMKDRITSFVRGMEVVCIYPFDHISPKCIDEGDEGAMKICRNTIDVCDQFGIFGISDTTLTELSYALGGDVRRVRVFVGEFDPEHRKWCEAYRSRYPKAIGFLESQNFGLT